MRVEKWFTVDVVAGLANKMYFVENYLGRVTKPRIIEAVREAKGDSSVELIAHLKKADMAREAERLLQGTGWLPEPLRALDGEVAADAEGEGIAALPAFLCSEDDETTDASEDPEPHPVAAE